MCSGGTETSGTKYVNNQSSSYRNQIHWYGDLGRLSKFRF